MLLTVDELKKHMLRLSLSNDIVTLALVSARTRRCFLLYYLFSMTLQSYCLFNWTLAFYGHIQRFDNNITGNTKTCQAASQ